MKLIKRLLSLVLALTMTLSTCVFVSAAEESARLVVSDLKQDTEENWLITVDVYYTGTAQAFYILPDDVDNFVFVSGRWRINEDDIYPVTVNNKNISTETSEAVLTLSAATEFDNYRVYTYTIKAVANGTADINARVKTVADGVSDSVEVATTGGKTITVDVFHEHDYTELNYDANGHWYECACGDKNTVESHTATEKVADEYLKSETTCSNPTVYYKSCSVCGEKLDDTFENGVPNADLHVWENKYDTINHWQECSECHQKKDEEAHDYATLKHDANGHWNECACGSMTAVESHQPDEKVDDEYLKSAATFTSPAVYYTSCSVCGEKLDDTFEYGDVVDNVISGTCGKNLTWTLDSDGLLTISGTGMMDNYSSRCAPWYQYVQLIKSAVIENGVTTIGDCAFDGCTQMTSLTVSSSVTNIHASAIFFAYGLTDINVDEANTAYKSVDGVLFTKDGTQLLRYPAGRSDTHYTIPDGVTDIGQRAFDNAKFESVTIPNSVTTIEYAAFYGATYLSSVIIPDSVTEIGNFAFQYCKSLTSINIPDNLVIDSSVLSGCAGLLGIDINETNNNYKLVDGVLLTKDGTTIVRYPTGRADTATYTIPETVTAIDDYAFDYSASLTSITIPGYVANVGANAFYGCSALESVTISKGVSKISGDAFGCCTNLKTVRIENSDVVIGKDAIPLKATIYGYAGSTAEAYAEANKNKFVEIEEEVTYTITFDANGGVGAPADQIKKHNETLSLSSVVPTRDGYVFYGWSTNKNATSATYGSGFSFNENANTTLYAVWGKAVEAEVILSKKVIAKGDTFTATVKFSGNAQGLYVIAKFDESIEFVSGKWKIDEDSIYPAEIIMKDIKKDSYEGVVALSDIAQFNETTVFVYTFKAVETATTSLSVIFKYILGGESGYTAVNTAPIAIEINEGYSVTYNANGGVGAPAAQTKSYYQALTLSTDVPTREGYNFLGWSEDKNATTATYQPGDSLTSDKDTSLYAVWKIKSYTVSFDANGGEGAPESQTKIYGQEFTTGSTVPTREGYDFLGWSDNKNATSAAYGVDATFTVDVDTTLYAIWKIKTYIVTFDANGGEGVPAQQTKTHNKTLTLTATVPTRKGYDFLGWSTSSTASEAVYRSGGTYTANENVTLYAVWKIKTYTVAFDANGGEGAPMAQTKTYDQTLTLSAEVPTREGYNFIGWATSSTATSATYSAGSSFTTNANTTLYAVWEIKTYTIKFVANGGLEVPDSQTKTHGKPLTLSEMILTREGYTFIGWSTDKNATRATYGSGQLFKVNEDTTLYAVWVKNAVVDIVVSDKLVTVGDTVEVSIYYTGAMQSMYTTPVFGDNFEFVTCSWQIDEDDIEPVTILMNRVNKSTREAALALSDSCEFENRLVCKYVYKAVAEGTSKIGAVVKSTVGSVDKPVVVPTTLIRVETCNYIPGDFTEDKNVTLEDAIYLLYHTFNPTGYPLNQPGDFTGDGNVTLEDAIYLLYHTFNPTGYPLTK